MFRLVPIAASALATLACAAPALSADYFDDMRPAYSDDWQDDSISFELGVRYWYSLGSQSIELSGDTFTADDQSHSAEGHFRINDSQTNTYLKGVAGYAFAINGTGTTPSGGVTVTDGKVGYIGADLGYAAFGNQESGVGPLIGYMYRKDAPNIGRESFTTATSAADINWQTGTQNWSVGFDSAPNDVDIHALRLGVSGQAKFGEMFDINAEVAAVPYARVSGTLGSFGFTPVVTPTTTTYLASPAAIDGWGYGAMGELMLGVHPTDNMIVRLGGRAWYLQGVADSTFDTVTITHPADADADPDYEVPPTYSRQSFISTANPFSFLRYGLLAEVSVKF